MANALPGTLGEIMSDNNSLMSEIFANFLLRFDVRRFHVCRSYQEMQVDSNIVTLNLHEIPVQRTIRNLTLHQIPVDSSICGLILRQNPRQEDHRPNRLARLFTYMIH